jgi:hypothetical protein
MKKATPKSSPNHVSQHDYINIGVLSHIESRFIPHAFTQARLLLEILSDGLEYSTQELTLKLGSDPRSARQSVSNNTHGYWHIINVAGKSKKGRYKLDPRHLSRLDGDDSRARAEAEITYLKRSEKGAWGGHVRHGSASEMVRKAEAKNSQLSLSLEGAA